MERYRRGDKLSGEVLEGSVILTGGILEVYRNLTGDYRETVTICQITRVERGAWCYVLLTGNSPVLY
ncbi:hypothetical protein Barb7_00171 [Bacteroidales bacterium Barb7]|nr:hypothetical protein Barb7_00171 [Bacteroidales bacterium Barb7]